MATVRQKLAFRKTLENGGSVSKAMIEINPNTNKPIYSPNTAHTPSKLTKTKGWEELLEATLSDRALAKKHKEILNKKEKIVVGVGKGYSQIEDTGQPHSDAVKALDIGYKLKHRYSDGKDTNLNINIIQGVEINIRKDETN